MRGTLDAALRFVLGLAVGSFAFELYLRTVEATPLWRILPVAEASLYGPSVEAGYTHRPGAAGVWITENRAAVEINAIGLRDDMDRSLVKAQGTRRFAVVGDSMVEALQVPQDESFVARTQATLRRRGHAGVEVVNLGLAGARPAVIVERLRLASRTLGLDGAIVLVSGGDFLVETEDDASEYAGYVKGPGGHAVISHAFRDGRGFKLRSGSVGAGIYWAMDHVRLALVLNNRKNTGLAADLAPQHVTRRIARNECGDSLLRPHEALWSGTTSGFADARLTAFLNDLSAIASESDMPLVLAVRGVAVQCPARAEGRKHLIEAMESRVSAAGLVFFDHEAAMEPYLAGRSRSDLHGFGSRIGLGHLNSEGHCVYEGVTTNAISAHLLKQP